MLEGTTIILFGFHLIFHWTFHLILHHRKNVFEEFSSAALSAHGALECSRCVRLSGHVNIINNSNSIRNINNSNFLASTASFHQNRAE